MSISLLVISCNGNQKYGSPFFEDKLVMESNERVAAYAIPNIVSTPKGTILCFATARIGDNHEPYHQKMDLQAVDTGMCGNFRCGLRIRRGWTAV